MENDKKITAVECLRKEIILNSKHKESSKGRISFEIGLSKFDELFIQAEDMGKEQIKDAHLIGLITSLEMEATKQSEQYYNETFKKK